MQFDMWRGSLDRGVEKKLFYSLPVFGSPTLKYSGSWLIILLSKTYYGSWLINTSYIHTVSVRTCSL